MATIDGCGICLISDVNTNQCKVHMDMKSSYSKNNLLLFFLKSSFCISFLDMRNRCRWSTNIGEPFLFVKYRGHDLNILDAEKQTLTLKEPVELEEASH